MGYMINRYFGLVAFGPHTGLPSGAYMIAGSAGVLLRGRVRPLSRLYGSARKPVTDEKPTLWVVIARIQLFDEIVLFHKRMSIDLRLLTGLRPVGWCDLRAPDDFVRLVLCESTACYAFSEKTSRKLSICLV